MQIVFNFTDEESDGFGTSKPHPVKGGTMINDYLTHGWQVFDKLPTVNSPRI